MKSPGDALADAFARHRKGDLAAADRIYRKVIKAQPGNADALYLLGMLCLDDGRAADSVRHLKKAVAAAARGKRRVDPGWRLALGTALQRAGDGAAALAEYEAALRADPASVDAMFCRATALQDLGRADEAIAAYEAMLAKNPKHAEAANNLGVVYRDMGKPGAALAAFQRSVAADPDYRDAQVNLGQAYADTGLVADALPLLRTAAARGPFDPAVEEKLFGCLVQLNLIDEIEARAETLLKERPGEPFLICQLGVARQTRGDGDGARARFRDALAANPAVAGAHIGLAEIPGEAGKETLIQEVERLIAEDAVGSEGKVALHFALGRHYAARGEHARSLAAYALGNEIKRATLAAHGHAYDRQKVTQTVDILTKLFGREALEASGINDSELPVFIVGMPRSGTTLTEQVLASHPKVFGAGELTFIGRTARELRRRFGYPDKPVPAGVLARVADAYIEPLARLGQGALRVTDKLPGNFMHIGLISQLFSQARIIHCRRGPMDTCLSCFQQNFGAAGLGWSTDFGDMAHEYCEYRRMMAHWRAMLPAGRMLEIDYEDTVADLEGQARRLVEFLGLDWDDACLRFYEAKGTVITASHSQVRRKLYASSVGRWKRYGDSVAPLIEGLAGCGCGPGAEGA
ncbi:MAG: sulfotransferase [Alphaproteobacteria bacterium]|nr:sulfotransferase [Alphaproteobacteria bacterium]